MERLGIKWIAVLGGAGLFLAGIGCEQEQDEDLEGGECEQSEALNPCGDEGSFNVCDRVDGELQWGECHELECTPGATEGDNCGAESDGLCKVEGGIPYWECTDWTPILLSFDGAEPVLTEAAAGTSFDVGSGGQCLHTDWPTARTPWLALDRDGNGTIEGGHELFGSGTLLPGGRRASQGFMALAELDSNGDGSISAADQRFGEILLWADHDRDKRSMASEHESLAARGIVSIELDWYGERICDARGNCGVERAAFTFIDAGGRASTGEVIDVHLPCR